MATTVIMIIQCEDGYDIDKGLSDASDALCEVCPCDGTEHGPTCTLGCITARYVQHDDDEFVDVTHTIIPLEDD